MIQKGQWTILPFSAVKDYINLCISPPGVIPQCNKHPRWIFDYSFYHVNDDTIPLFAKGSMQFRHTLHWILWHILLADPNHGPIYMLKIDIADRFYRIDLIPEDIPHLVVIFPTLLDHETLIEFPLVLLMGWKNSPPAFTTTTEMIADLANSALHAGQTLPAHKLEGRAAQHDEYLAPNAIPTLSPTVAPDPSIPPQIHPAA
jgi:hypothetical protein